MNKNIGLRDERGFTLIELVIAIVVVGVLSAVAIVGIGGLTDRGKKASCNATRDAAKTAVAVYFANNSSYPTNFNPQLTSGAAPLLDVPSTVTASGGSLSTSGSNGWTITMTGGGATPPVLSDCPAS
jgi:prepilin-type N-terminal cleavage/methylation domain-containing protein